LVVVQLSAPFAVTFGYGTRQGSDATVALFIGLQPPQHGLASVPIMHAFTGTHAPLVHR
jgi:hypothetical protein